MSNSALVLMIAGVAAFFFALLVSALSRHKKKFASQQLNVIGRIGVIETQLNPEGAIIVNGELWRARLNDGTAAKSETNVRVVGVQGHLLLVEPESDKLF